MGDAALVGWIGLGLCPQIGGIRMRRLLAHFGDAQAILNASDTELLSIQGIGKSAIQNIRAINLDILATLVARWQSLGVHCLTWDMPEYPPQLLALPDAPPTLFALGDITVWQKRTAYAVVGTRQPSAEKRTETIKLTAEMARSGHLVVSGLAHGIDAAAHLGVLTEDKGRTIAILGSGVLNVYPLDNRGLSHAILERGGALLCEVAPDMPASAWGLVGRNRLMVAMSDALIVMQTQIDGGAMHAVKFAKRQNKPIYADNNLATGNQAILNDGGHDLIYLVF